MQLISPFHPSMLALAILFSLVLPSAAESSGLADPAWQRGRQIEWLEFATQTPLSPGSVANVLAHLERDARDSADDEFSLTLDFENDRRRTRALNPDKRN